MGSTWAMEYLEPEYPLPGIPLNPDNPGQLVSTPPMAGTNTIGIDIQGVPLGEVKPFMLDGMPLADEPTMYVLDIPLDLEVEPLTILESKDLNDWRTGRRLTTSKGRVMREFGVSKREFNKIIHDLNPHVQDNPDYEFDLDTGEIFDQRSGEWIGSLLDYFD